MIHGSGRVPIYVQSRLLVLISMPFDGASSGGKRYGAGQRHIFPGSFQKGSENREKTEE